MRAVESHKSFVQTIRFRWKNKEGLCFITMMSDAKFWRKTDSWFQKKHEKFGEFLPSYSKSKNFTLMGYFCSKYEVWAKNIQTSSFMTLNSDAKFE